MVEFKTFGWEMFHLEIFLGEVLVKMKHLFGEILVVSKIGLVKLARDLTNRPISPKR